MLGVSLVAIKAYHLGVPPRDGLSDYLRSLSAISYVDALFAAVCWAAARLVLLIAGRRPFAGRAVSGAFMVFAAFCCFYAVVNIVLFGIVGGFLTYPLLALIGDVRMVRSSVGAHVTLPAIAGLIGIPCVYLASVAALTRLMRAASTTRWGSASAVILAAWVAAGHYTYVTQWDTLPSRRVAESPHWAIAASTWHAFADGGFVRMAGDVHARRPRGLRSAEGAADADGLRGVERDSSRDRHARRACHRSAPAAQRCAHRPGVGGGSVDQPAQSALRHDTNAAGGIGAQRGRGQFLRAHRPKLQFDGRDAVIDVPEARFPRVDRAVSELSGHVAGDHVSKPRVSDDFRHAERHGMGRLARVPRRPRLRGRPGLPRPCLSGDALVVGSRGSLHGRQGRGPDCRCRHAALFRDRVDDANAPSVRAQSWSSPAQSAAGVDPRRLGSWAGT